MHPTAQDEVSDETVFSARENTEVFDKCFYQENIMGGALVILTF